MPVTCVSASNTKLMGGNSASTKVCGLIGDILHKDYDTSIDVNVVPLMDYDMVPCHLCGRCAKDGKCIYDNAFNKLFSQLSKSDAIFFVVPHYSPIPSKLIIMFEKLNEIAYGGWLKDKGFKFPLQNKTVGIIGHGGMPENEEVLDYYHEHLVGPIAKTLRSLSFKVIGRDDHYTDGIVFGLKDEDCLRETEGGLFPEIVQDWSAIETRIRPFVNHVIRETLDKDTK